MNDDDPKKPTQLSDFQKKKKAQKPLDWKITYQIQNVSPKKKIPNTKLLFWIKFVAYIALVSYGLKQCGY